MQLACGGFELGRMTGEYGQGNLIGNSTAFFHISTPSVVLDYLQPRALGAYRVFTQKLVMASGTDLASTIGTWIAAFLAIVALVGVVGPLLVWRASKGSRNKALAALEAGTADSAGYVSRGIPIGWNVRLLRRVRAPVLTKRPPVAGQCLKWNSSQELPDKESPSWVKLGAVLDGYGISYRTGDCVIIDDDEKKAVLPVARIWLLVVGMIGRFGHRRDNGRLPKPLPKKLKSIQARPGQHIPVPSATPERKKSTVPGWMTSRPDWARVPNAYHPNARHKISRLYGVTGLLQFHSGNGSSDQRSSESVFLHTHEQMEIGDLASESLSLDNLFWLSVGCLPLRDGRVLCLENVEIVTDDGTDDELMLRAGDRELPSPAAHVRFADHYAGDDDDDSSSDYEPWMRGGHDYSDPVSRKTFQEMLSPTSYLVRGKTARANDHNAATNGPRMFCFAATEERSRSLVEVAITVGAESDDITTMSLSEVEVTADDMELLEQDSRATYPPSEHPWVRLGSRNEPGNYASGAWFMERKSAHLVALALINLPLCAQGCLIYKPRASACRGMLVAASGDLPRLLIRIMHGLGSLKIEPEDKKDSLFKHMVDLSRMTEAFEYSRTFSNAIYALDNMLDSFTGSSELARRAVQVLTITSPEFRNIVGQSIRRIDACAGTTVKLDLATSAVGIPTVFGIIQKFPVKIDVLVDDPQALQRTGHIDIVYPVFVMLVLKAALRSAFLDTSLDSLPLFEKVMSLEDVVHVI
ncbi:hypothetical protein LTR85_011189 [Meristemomyces frigidus]|nr:hypothetical protein LTR85_011189 [Meristemomyces frigidus]